MASRAGPHRRRNCRFLHAVCHKCQRTGHIAKVCRSSRNSHQSNIVHSEQHQSTLEASTDFDEGINFSSLVVETSDSTTLHSPSTKPHALAAVKPSLPVLDQEHHLYHRLTFTLTGKRADSVIDTGSPVSFMSRDEFKRLCTSSTIQSTSDSIQGVTGAQMITEGEGSCAIE